MSFVSLFSAEYTEAAGRRFPQSDCLREGYDGVSIVTRNHVADEKVCEMVVRGKNSDGLQKRLHYRFALFSAPESRHALAVKRGFGSRSASEVVAERFLQNRRS